MEKKESRSCPLPCGARQGATVPVPLYSINSLMPWGRACYPHGTIFIFVPNFHQKRYIAETKEVIDIKQIKCRHMMYTQQIKHLPAKTVDNHINEIEALNPERYAVIVHDNETDENGKPEEEHIHTMMSFRNARSCASVAKHLHDKPQYVEAWKGNSNNGYAYLVHATKNAVSKRQYDPNKVIANFDYPALLQKIEKEVSKASNSLNVATLLDALYEGLITKDQLEEKLTGSQIARYKRQIEDVWSKWLQKQAKQFRAEMLEQGRKTEVIWIYGEAGVGKTRLAKDFAKKRHDRPYYIAGSSKDAFQNYTGEHTLILDELRPSSMMPYQDLLRILDPYGEQVMLPSRYSDKALACDLIIITSPYSPASFYEETIFFAKRKIDTFEQLQRRLSLVVEIDASNIHEIGFINTEKYIVTTTHASRANPYSSSNQSAPGTQTNNLFNMLFD